MEFAKVFYNICTSMYTRYTPTMHNLTRTFVIDLRRRLEQTQSDMASKRMNSQLTDNELFLLGKMDCVLDVNIRKFDKHSTYDRVFRVAHDMLGNYQYVEEVMPQAIKAVRTIASEQSKPYVEIIVEVFNSELITNTGTDSTMLTPDSIKLKNAVMFFAKLFDELTHSINAWIMMVWETANGVKPDQTVSLAILRCLTHKVTNIPLENVNINLTDIELELKSNHRQIMEINLIILSYLLSSDIDNRIKQFVAYCEGFSNHTNTKSILQTWAALLLAHNDLPHATYRSLLLMMIGNGG